MDKKGKLNIYVDLDGTLAHREDNAPLDYIGVPIQAVVDKIKKWIGAGHKYTIFTARVSQIHYGLDWADFQHGLISKWLYQNKIPSPESITAEKSPLADYYIDDKGISVEKNTGEINHLPEELK